MKGIYSLTMGTKPAENHSKGSFNERVNDGVTKFSKSLNNLQDLEDFDEFQEITTKNPDKENDGEDDGLAGDGATPSLNTSSPTFG